MGQDGTRWYKMKRESRVGEVAQKSKPMEGNTMEKIMYSIKNVDGKITLEYLAPSDMLRDASGVESVAQALLYAVKNSRKS